MSGQVLFRGRVKSVYHPSMDIHYNKGASCIVTTSGVSIGGSDPISVSIDDVNRTQVDENEQGHGVLFDTRIDYWVVFFNTEQECRGFHNAVKRAANS